MDKIYTKLLSSTPSSNQHRLSIDQEDPQKLNYQATVSEKKEKKRLMEFFIKGPDPASQHLNGKKNMV